MLTVYSKSQARRRLRRLLVLVEQGQRFVITQRGKAICLLEQAEAQGGTLKNGLSCKPLS
jgi:antitoxin (DNA-binding transcriptional repressor) of toxin-antitoxin stability system